MAEIYDYLTPLHQGIWEVVIPKEDLTSPLGSEWKQSPINVPTPGTIASFRNGQYHLHETTDSYRIHLDRYDPEKNPFLHLIDDAPLVLMIYETMATLYLTRKDAKRANSPALLSDLRMTYRLRIGFGIFIILISGIMLLISLKMSEVFFSHILPSLVSLTGIVILLNGIIMRERKENTLQDISNGLLILFAGFCMYLLWGLYLTIILLILAIWLLSSAYVTITRILREKTRVTQGFGLTLGMGLGSLILGIYAISAPAFLIEILETLLAVLVFLIGALLVTDGYGLLNAERLMKKRMDTKDQ